MDKMPELSGIRREIFRTEGASSLSLDMFNGILSNRKYFQKKEKIHLIHDVLGTNCLYRLHGFDVFVSYRFHNIENYQKIWNGGKLTIVELVGREKEVEEVGGTLINLINTRLKEARRENREKGF